MSNEATDLLSGASIEQMIQARIESESPVAVLFLDVNHFDAYAGEYGWSRGKEVIDMLSRLLVEIMGDMGQDGDCAAHISGDEFIIATVPERATPLAQEAIKRFDKAILEYCTPQDRERRYIDGLDRRGNPFRVLLPSLSIGVVTNGQRVLEHYLQVEELGAEVSQYIKLWPGSNYAFDGRHK